MNSLSNLPYGEPLNVNVVPYRRHLGYAHPPLSTIKVPHHAPTLQQIAMKGREPYFPNLPPLFTNMSSGDSCPESPIHTPESPESLGIPISGSSSPKVDGGGSSPYSCSPKVSLFFAVSLPIIILFQVPLSLAFVLHILPVQIVQHCFLSLPLFFLHNSTLDTTTITILPCSIL